ncbi:hypothetical protein C0Q70_01689 [Pomacea canaliculata]|uniref:Uncharacterized protein n=1 Tax=Pomacea canaliculata TaxID=400727 RepID=A0A2T7Q069_POMCA|nr:hypothetical protein C0Q70_01689 [Pomacea canaliculata]
MDTCASFPKYKHSILHRYLSDAHHQPIILDEDAVAKSRDRHHSSSTGSRDIEDMSTSSVSSPAHETHHDTQEVIRACGLGADLGLHRMSMETVRPPVQQCQGGSALDWVVMGGKKILGKGRRWPLVDRL